MKETKTGTAKKISSDKMTAILIFVAVFTVVGGFLLYSELTEFDYSKNLNETVLTVGDRSVTLKELSYYIILTERTGNERALAYDEANPASYWNIYLNRSDSVTDGAPISGYMTDIAKYSVLNYCVRDMMYAMEAETEQYTLSEEEAEEIRYDAEQFYYAMSQREQEVTGLLPADLEAIMLREALAHSYMSSLAVADEDGALASILLEYDVGGSYYNELCETKYPVVLHTELWEDIRIGFVTIN